VKRLFLICLCASASFTAEVAGPVSGYLFEQGAVRPILGIPGAARVGEPVLTGVLAASSVAGAALSCPGGIVSLASPAGKVTRVETLNGCPEQAIFSPTGTAAALFYGSRVVVLRGDQVAGQVDSAAACTPSDDAELLLCPTGETIQVLERTGVLRATLRGRLAAFIPASHDSVVATDSQILLLREGADSEAIGNFESATSISAMAGTVVAARGDELMAVTVATRVATRLQAPSAVTGLHVVRAGEALHVATDGPGPLWLLAVDPGGLKLMFVPREEASNE
jgi:hypothetical protein